MATTKPIAAQFAETSGGYKTLTDSNFFRNAILNMNSSSSTYGITATGTTQATATPLGSVLNQVDTVTSNTGVNLPLSTGTHGTPCQWVIVVNNGANALSIYGAQNSTDSINGVAGSTALSLPAGAVALFNSVKGGAWFTGDIGGTASFGALTATTFNGNTLATGANAIALNSPTPVLAGATLAVTAAMSNSTILLNIAAGSTITLPAATGSGNNFKFYVSTTATSNAHKILAASSSDFLNGVAVGHVSAGTTLTFSAAAATAHSIQMPFAGTQPSGGFIGDHFEFTDVAANLWMVRGMYQSGTTSTTPFSAATS